MSIPTPFDPLGTLGAAARHVQDGLILRVSVLAAGSGNITELTDDVTGNSLQLTRTTSAQELMSGSDVGIIYPSWLTTDFSCHVEMVMGVSSGNNIMYVYGPAIGKYISLTGGKINCTYASVSFKSASGNFSSLTSFSVPPGESSNLYINGSEQSCTFGSDYWGIHNSGLVNDRGANCKFREIRIYNRRLTTEEVLKNYNIDKKLYGL